MQAAWSARPHWPAEQLLLLAAALAAVQPGERPLSMAAWAWLRALVLAQFDKMAVQNVFAAAHRPEDRPIAHSEHDEGNDTDLKHHRGTIKWRIVLMSCVTGQATGRSLVSFAHRCCVWDTPLNMSDPVGLRPPRRSRSGPANPDPARRKQVKAAQYAFDSFNVENSALGQKW
jgi:hypothetical protein